MKFMLKIEGSEWFSRSDEEREFGLDTLDHLRVQFGPDIIPEDVPCSAHLSSGNPVITLTEEEARECGLFRDRCDATVKVKSGSMNHFYVPHWKRDPQGRLRVVLELDKARFWAAFRESGWRTEPKPEPEPGQERDERGRFKAR